MLLLGVVQAQAIGVPVAAGSFDLLQSEVLTSTAASVTFSGLDAYASTYQHLQLRITTRTNRGSADSDPVLMQINGDTGANYSRHGLGGYYFGGGGAVYSNGQASQNYFYLTEAMPVTSSTTNAFGAIVADILDPFNASKNTTVRSLAGMNAAWSSIELRSGAWLNTSAVTSITLKPLIGTSLVQYSRFSLFGVKKAA